MARKLHSNLETRSARLRLPVSSKPVFVTVGEGSAAATAATRVERATGQPG